MTPYLALHPGFRHGSRHGRRGSSANVVFMDGHAARRTEAWFGSATTIERDQFMRNRRSGK